MKKNIQLVKINKDEPEAKWLTWDAFCDDCGTQLHKAGEIFADKDQELSENDLCVSCLGQRMGMSPL